MTDKSADYKERHLRWQNYTITQLGYVNNIIFTISIGFLAFAFDKEFLSTFSFMKDSVFSWKMLFYLMTIFCLTASIWYSIVTSISRLYDFRITRQITLTRMRYYSEFKDGDYILPDYDFRKPKCKEKFGTFCKIIFKELVFLTKQETKLLKQQSNLMKKFNYLRKLSHNLGIISWRGMKMQLLFLFSSLIFYIISLLA